MTDTHFTGVKWGSSPDSSYQVKQGVETVNGTNAAGSTIVTGLTTVTAFSLTPMGNTATLANNCVAVTGSLSSGSIVMKRFKHTGASTPTLIAATTGGTVHWIAVGT